MGEIAEMMLDGTLCEGCGVANLSGGEGFPWHCRSCKRDRNIAADEEKKAAERKVKCDVCGKKVREVGLADHKRAVHSNDRSES